MFKWLFGKRRYTQAPPREGPQPFEEDLEHLRQILRQQGVPEEGIEKVCGELQQEVEIMAQRQREQARSGQGPGGVERGRETEPEHDADAAANTEQSDGTRPG